MQSNYLTILHKYAIINLTFEIHKMNLNLKLIEEKYQEIKSLGEDEGFLNEESFGKIKLFINKKPSHLLFSTKKQDDILYVGTN